MRITRDVEKMKIICLTGTPGAGKGEISKILKEKNIPVIVMSDVPREEVRKRGLEMNIKNLDTVALDLRKKFGRDVVAKRVAEKLKEIKSDIVCVDGFRNVEELDIIKAVGDIKIITVDAPRDVRFERLVKRGHDRDPKNIEEFEWREQKQKEIGLDKVLTMGDYRIENNDSLDELKIKVERLLADMGHV